MLNSPKKYRGIKFLNVDQQFLNVKVLNKNKAKKALSINTPKLCNRTNEKSLKSSVIDSPYKTEEEKSPILRNNSIKKSNKKLLAYKRINSIKIKDSNIYKLIKKKNIGENKDRPLSPYKIIKSKPRRVDSLSNYISCKNMYIRSSLFNNKNKDINSPKKMPKSNKDFNNIKYSKINEKSKKKNKSKDRKTININNNIKSNSNSNNNKKDCVNIIQLKTGNLTNYEDIKDNKDEKKISKNIKKHFCCI